MLPFVVKNPPFIGPDSPFVAARFPVRTIILIFVAPKTNHNPK